MSLQCHTNAVPENKGKKEITRINSNITGKVNISESEDTCHIPREGERCRRGSEDCTQKDKHVSRSMERNV